MYESNLAKFTQHEDLKRLLTSSTGAITARGGFWKTWNEVLLERCAWATCLC